MLGSCWVFTSLYASELICPALRIWEECLSCVGITEVTNPSQFIGILKVKTFSMSVQVDKLMGVSILSPFHLFIFSPFHLFTFSHFPFFTFSHFPFFTFSHFPFFTFSPFHLFPFSPFPFFTFSLFHL